MIGTTFVSSHACLSVFRNIGSVSTRLRIFVSKFWVKIFPALLVFFRSTLIVDQEQYLTNLGTGRCDVTRRFTAATTNFEARPERRLLRRQMKERRTIFRMQKPLNSFGLDLERHFEKSRRAKDASVRPDDIVVILAVGFA